MDFNNLTAYELINTKELRDIKSEGYILRHKKSGARIVLVKNDDTNKVFNIGFRTPPEDSTGLPHILEHSVLCGSKNFPIKDPFVELVKGSLNTFLNAMTYPDKTLYPVASCNDTDFQNLMNVYMDAVLYPNIYEQEEIFRQEGWSYKLENIEDELTYNGVVYNEMKGAFSSPESVLDRLVLNSLFPDTSYSNESGGDPEVIPELSYEDFLEFHGKYYHPSNSYIYLYGDMDFQKKLLWLDEEYLSNFEEIEIDSKIKYQEPFKEMIEVKKKYSIASNEEEKDNTFLSWNKVIGTSLDKELSVAFEILDYALLSAPGAPLKKALIDAKIGKDIFGSFEDGIYQPMFSIVAKGSNPEVKNNFINVIEDTLKKLIKEGINPKSLEAGINSQDFSFREADYGRYPKGLMYGLDMFSTWLYDDNDPFSYVELLDIFESLREKISEGYFEELIEKYLLDNTHGSLVMIEPEKGRTKIEDDKLKEKLQAYKEKLTDEEIQNLVQKTKELEEYQDAPSKEEDLAKIPVLKRTDISKKISEAINEELYVGDTLVLHHDIETNGIAYMKLLFDISSVPNDLLPYVGLLNACMGMVDTKDYEYGELFNEINLHTGGISSGVEIYPDVTKVQQKAYKVSFELNVKSLYQNIPKALELMIEMMDYTNWDDNKRIKEILDMLDGRLKSKFQSSGHTTAMLRAMSYGSEISKFRDVTSGISFFEFITELNGDFENKKETISKNLRELCKIVFRPENLMLSYTSAKDGLEGLNALIEDVKIAIRKDAIEVQGFDLALEELNEGFKCASKVQYVAQVGNFMDKGVPYTGALQILKVILSYEYLWQNVRVKGGAYGCMSGFNRIGEGYFVSYRDPNLLETFNVYKDMVKYLEGFDVSEQELTKFIIGTMSDLDQPMTPSVKGERSLNLYLNNVSNEMLERERLQILDAKVEDIRATSKVVEAILSYNQICVIGSEEKIEEKKELFGTTREIF